MKFSNLTLRKLFCEQFDIEFSAKIRDGLFTRSLLTEINSGTARETNLFHRRFNLIISMLIIVKYFPVKMKLYITHLVIGFTRNTTFVSKITKLSKEQIYPLWLF